MDNNSAWNPGLQSDIPREFETLETIYCLRNVSTTHDDVKEITSQTGLNVEDVVTFAPIRLILHELMVRVMADFSVVESGDEEGFDRNYQHIVHQILDHYIRPKYLSLIDLYFEMQLSVQGKVNDILEITLFPEQDKEMASAKFSLFGLFSASNKNGRRKASSNQIKKESIEEREFRIVSSYKEMGLNSSDRLEQVVYRSLYRILGSIASHRGMIGKDQELIARLVVNHVCNDYGSQLIGEAIDPYIRAAIEEQGYPVTMDSVAPKLISLKGPSAAGKSYLRMMLQGRLDVLGIESTSCGIISPDVWRRLLLDYDTLGEAYKYAGRFTSVEVSIIDCKLDYYIRNRADRNRSIPNLLVDRFRFDSFSSENISRILHDTYARYVDTMYMYFLVTPPEAIVERGWCRGLKHGRYKAVEDYLGHSVEAYVGMPKILFKWLAYPRPLFQYEFMDNSVPKGTYPKTIAYGTQEEMNIVDIEGFINIERYQKININAKSPGELYPDEYVLEVCRNLRFLNQCIEKIPEVNFVDEGSKRIYARVSKGKFIVIDTEIFNHHMKDRQSSVLFMAIAPSVL